MKNWFIPRCLGVSFALLVTSLAYAQDEYQQVVVSTSQGDKVFLEVNARHLQQSIDSLFFRIDPENFESTDAWSDVLENGNNPGMDVNFSAYDAYGITDLTADGTLTADSLVLGKDASIAGSLNVTGIAGFGDDLTVSGYVTLSDSLEVVRATSIGETLYVTGVTTLGDSLHVAGKVNMAQLLNVVGAATFGSTVSVSGATSLGSTLSVSGVATLNDSLIVGGGASIATTLRADSISVTDVINGEVSSIGNHDTDDLTEGDSNLYFTSTRARSAVTEDLDSLYNLVGDLRTDMDSLHAGTCTTLNYNGYDYELVEIGGECWFAENLQTTLYQDGTPLAAPDMNCGFGEVCFGDNENFDDAHYSDFYTDGLAYTWFAVANTENGGLCPSGYRVASSADWETLHANYDYDSSLGWDLVATPEPGLNTDGFNATLSGYVVEDPNYSWDPDAAFYGDGGAKNLEFGESGGWWTLAQINATEASAHRVTKAGATATWAAETFDKFTGFGVRCVLGTETLVSNMASDTLTANHLGVMSDSLYVGGNANLAGDVNIGSSLMVNDTNILAIIASLQAQIDALSGGTPAAATTPCADETTYTYHEVTYNLVELGDDCWFADDLATENLNTGQSVPDYGVSVMNTAQPWDPVGGPQHVSSPYGGNAYNYIALVSDALCPKGWHVPTVDDVNNASGDAGFASAFSSGGFSWDTDYAVGIDGAWAIATTPGPQALTVFYSNGSMSDLNTENAGAVTRCVKD